MNQTTEIFCKGRYSTSLGKIPCKHEFVHFGNWNDNELIEHQKLEESTDSKQDWWIGFDTDKKFENIQSKIEEVKDE